MWTLVITLAIKYRSSTHNNTDYFSSQPHKYDIKGFYLNPFQ